MKSLINSQTSNRCLGMEKWFHLTLYWTHDNLSMLGIKVIYVNKSGPRWHCKGNELMEISHIQNEWVNTLRTRRNSRNFPDDIFKCIFLSEKVWIPIKISLKFVPGGPINNIPALVQIMAWCRQGNKPLSQPMMVRLPTHICVTRSQWVNTISST